MEGRTILMAGLPAGQGVSSLSLALGDALAELGRDVLVATALDNMPPAEMTPRGERRDTGLVLQMRHGPGLCPLEFLAPPQTASLRRLSEEADFLLIDRFTGLAVADSSWYNMADEVLLLVDAREDGPAKGLLLASRILRDQPGLPVYVCFNRISYNQDWQQLGEEFNSRLESLGGRELLILGGIREALDTRRASREQVSLLRAVPNHPNSRVIRSLARRLLHLEMAWAHRPDLLVHAPQHQIGERSLMDGR